MLTSNLQQPVMSETSVLLDLLHPLNIVSDLGIQGVRTDVDVATVPVLLSSVQEPGGNTVGAGVGNDLSDFLPGLLGDLAGALEHVDLSQLADQVSESSADTFDRGQGVGNSSLTFDVSVEHSDDQLEFCLFVVNKALALVSLPFLPRVFII